MIEDTGDIWEYPADALVITTNGYVKKNGRAVMGRGSAKEAADRWNFLPALLGEQITKFGNEVFIWSLMYIEEEEVETKNILTMPVKHNWWEPADIFLIHKSAMDLKAEVDMWNFKSVVMGRPGCGNGGLDWDSVRPVLENVLDDRFVAITNGY